MPDGLYERDVLAWSEQQADLLGRMAAGERVDEAVDWANVIEEVRDLGRSELHTVESLLEQAMRHLLKLRARPDNPSAPHWRGEIVTFLAGAQRRYGLSMQQRIDMDDIFCGAKRAVQEIFDGAAAMGAHSPWTMEQLLDPDIDVRVLVACLDAARRLGDVR